MQVLIAQPWYSSEGFGSEISMNVSEPRLDCSGMSCMPCSAAMTG